MKIYRCEHVPMGDYAGRGVCTLGDRGAVMEFRTASVKNVHHDQLVYSGWTVIKIGDVWHYYCPGHKPPPTTMEQKYSTRR